MPDLGTIGSANVELQAKLDQFEQGLSAAQSKLRVFDQSTDATAAHVRKLDSDSGSTHGHSAIGNAHTRNALRTAMDGGVVEPLLATPSSLFQRLDHDRDRFLSATHRRATRRAAELMASWEAREEPVGSWSKARTGCKS
jgi:hypothetical protein